jgi:hypothetical protein
MTLRHLAVIAPVSLALALAGPVAAAPAASIPSSPSSTNGKPWVPWPSPIPNGLLGLSVPAA